MRMHRTRQVSLGEVDVLAGSTVFEQELLHTLRAANSGCKEDRSNYDELYRSRFLVNLDSIVVARPAGAERIFHL